VQFPVPEVAPGIDDDPVLVLVFDQHFARNDQKKIPARETCPVENFSFFQGNWIKERQQLPQLFVTQEFKEKMVMQKGEDSF